MTSILKVSEIQDPTNSNTALTIDSSGIVALPNSVYISRFRLTSDWTTNATITAWGGYNRSKQVQTIGTAVTVSSGIFTFPATGIWKVTVQARALAVNGDSTVGFAIQATDDNSTYTDYAFASEGHSTGTSTGSLFAEEFINVDNVSNVKVLISGESIASGSKIYGTTTDTRTQVVFERITASQ
jgi:hypothetical protein